MFEKVTLAISGGVYTLLICAGLGWLAWVCLANTTLGLAVTVFIPTAVLLIALLGPVAMAIAGLIGILGGCIAVLVALAKRQKATS